MEFNLHDFQSFQNRLKLLESLGDGTETFTEEIDIYGKMKNLEIYPYYNQLDEEFDEIKTQISPENVTMIDMIIKTKKSHLFHLLPLLSDFIT